MLGVGLLLVLLRLSSATLISIEAETSRGEHVVRNRDNASNGKTVLLKEGDVLAYRFCLLRSTQAFLKDVVFSNDGNQDHVSITLDQEIIGSFTTESKSGHGSLWNVMKRSGKMGTRSLEGGIHRLKMKVIESDEYGIEIDKILIEIDDPLLTSESAVLNCSLPCIKDPLALESNADQSVTDGYILQKSYPTLCAEEDNVHIQLFHNSVKEYTVTAYKPQMYTFQNLRDEDTKHCPFLDPVYWKFEDVPLENLLISPKVSNRAILAVNDDGANGIHNLFSFQVLFHLAGRTEGHIDSEIGSELTLKLDGLTSTANVTVLYKEKKSGLLFKETSVPFSGSSPSHKWTIADFTWFEKQENEIILKIFTNQTNGIIIDDFHLERRYMGSDKPFVMYKDEEVAIEGVDIDFWWLAPDSMKVTISTTSQTYENADYLRIALPVPWNETWSQVFVLYQDGNVRLLPPVPPAADWIPFGTSVIVGQTLSSDFRPVAPIASVVVNPDTLVLNVTYRDGGQATLKVHVQVDRTELRVSNLLFKQDTEANPFAIFRSMYVDAGNDDSDSVMTDKEGPRHVMGKWDTLSGTSFLLFRRCESSHLTQSPDIRVDINKV
ncbi:uncharacterized protein LOC124291638 [Haliotis rubra]|uniref:uncharacterized protein LOC124291638 n=1 Tax=Haliotis rubra TaxID=36100 RepID=UPI001EE61864|nr:uncharacterized protein LOC124291638 [Haliotis rubra]